MAISAAPDEVLLPIAIRGGMRPDIRVFRWRQVAQIALTQFHGDLDPTVQFPLAEARKTLKQFPGISDSGTEKILLLCGVASGSH